MGLSVVPDITETLPATFTAKALSQSVANDGNAWDVNIAGVGWMLAANDSTPYQRQSVPLTKDQVDTSKEAGEQSLNGYWLRSQTSWHKGSGANFYEPGSDETTQYRSTDSVGVDVWTEGEARLLHRLVRADTTVTGTSPQYATYGVGKLWVVDGTTVKRFAMQDGAPTVEVSVPKKTNDPLTPVVLAGSRLVVGTAAGVEVCVDALDPTPTFSIEWTGAGACRPWWVKDRLVLADGPDLREVSLDGGDLSTVTPFYSHSDPGWTWTAVCETGQTILAAGYSGDQSGVYSFSLVDPGGGGSPVLGSPAKALILPPGETIHALQSYLGTYLGIGTSRGLRVGITDGSGAVNYGPLTVLSTLPVTCLSGADRFLYAGVQEQIGGDSGAVRVDLSSPVDGLRFPWAWDVQAHVTGVVDTVTLTPDVDPRVILGIRGKGIYTQHATMYEAEGSILTGKVRYGTVAPKSFERVDIGADVTKGSVVLAAVDDNDQEVTIYTMGAGAGRGRDIALTFPAGINEYLSLRFTLRCGADGTGTPVLASWQLRALPKPSTQRKILFPLSCADKERSRTGVAYGREGFAWARLASLEELQDQMVTVTVQDFTNKETFTAVIENVEFTRVTPPSRDGRGNFGGTCAVTVRKLGVG